MKKLKVMIADEDPLSRNLLESSLSYWGCDVVTVHNAAEAYGVLRAGNVQVCILNWALSAFSTSKFCAWIRETELKTQPCVIVLTEKTTRETIRAAYLAGANDFLAIPFQVEELRTRISAIARKASHLNSCHPELGRMDPLEYYRMDLASHSRLHMRV
jgi:DNA-binding response OmpR family regulator